MNDRDPTSPAGPRRPPWLALALPLVAAVVALGYARAVPYAFHFDDFSSIRDNAHLASPLELARVWAFWPSRFVVYESFALNRALTGAGPAGFRIVNLVLHALAALLVGGIARSLAACFAAAPAPAAPARRRRGRAAPAAAPAAATSPADGGAGADLVGLFAALLFAAHPLATQAVTYLVQRTASLCATFELAAIALSLRARERDTAWAWGAAYAAALLAAFTKEMAVALPVLLLLVHLAWTRAGGRDGRTPWARLAPFALVWPLVAWAGQLPVAKAGHVIAGLRETADIGRGTYLLTELTVIPRYLGLALWPAGQNLDPAITLRTAPDAAVLLGLLVLALATAGAVAARRHRPLVAIGWAWFLLALLPESSLFPIRDPMVEHRAYLPLAGIAWAAATLLVGTARWRRAGLAVALALVLALAVVTNVRNAAWRDEVSLWRDVTAKSPARPRGWNDLGLSLEAAGRPDEAEASYRRAIALDSTDVDARSNLGKLLGQRGRLRESLATLIGAARIAPADPDVLDNLGATLEALGDTAAAASAWSEALADDPGETAAAVNLARLRAFERRAATGGGAGRGHAPDR